MVAEVETVAGIAKYLRTSEDVIQLLVRERRIPHVKLGPRKTIFYVAAIDRWLAEESSASLSSSDPPTLGLVADSSPHRQ